MAESVSLNELQVGTVYFSVQFVDDDLLIPIVEPLVFIGRELMQDDSGILYFQDAESYRDGIRFESSSSEARSFFAQDENEVKHVFEYDEALLVLQACSLRRKKHGGDVSL